MQSELTILQRLSAHVIQVDCVCVWINVFGVSLQIKTKSQ